MGPIKDYFRYAIRLLIIFSAALFLIHYAVLPSHRLVIEGSTSDSLSGYAWGDTIGWVSFNCSDAGTCGASSYGVTMSQSSGDLSGYAWSDNVGWFSFQPADVVGCPAVPCAPNVNRTTGAVTGWFKAQGGGTGGSGAWDGWVQLSGNWSDGTRAASSNTALTGYAWGSDVVGWLDMSRVVSSVPLVCSASAGQSCSTAQNSCGLRNWGTNRCDGSCSVQFVPPESACAEVNAGTGCITLSASPRFVGQGGSTTLTWDGSCQSDSCTLYRSDTGGLIATSTTGSSVEASITARRTYIFSCGTQSVSTTAGPTFEFREF